MKLTVKERAIVKHVTKELAKKYSRARTFMLFVGARYNTEKKDIPASINVRKVSSDPDWNDTDLDDNSIRFTSRLDIPMADDGTAEVDLWIYESAFNDHGELVCNAQLELDADGLKAIHADNVHNVWTR